MNSSTTTTINNNKLIYIASKGRNFRGSGGDVMRSDVYATVER